ncbi:MAG TPA: ATP-grasp domain-containing protein, partial [Firmicutes bacterium]|nr:ATP-grasp domain-containing protein [Bacillota bacterium]
MTKRPFIAIITGSVSWSNNELHRILTERKIETQVFDLFNKRIRFYDIYHNSNFLINRVFPNELIPEYYSLIREISSLLDVFMQLNFTVLNPPPSYFFDISKMRTFLQLMKFKVPLPKFRIYENNDSFSELSFPIIIKPNCSGKGYLTQIAENKKDAAHFISNNISKLQPDNFFIIQEYVKSKEPTILRVEKFGDFFTVLKISSKPRKNTPEKQIILREYPNELIDIAQMTFNCTNINLGSVDIIVGADNQYYVLDINPTSRFEKEDIELFNFNPMEVYA